MKRFLYALLALSLLSLPACRAKTYRNDLSPRSLALLGAESIGIAEPQFADSDALAEITGASDETPDITVCYSADGNSLDEFGIWRTDRDSVKTVAPLLRTYLETTYQNNRAYYDSYIPTETPKLRDAEIRIYGSYVVYAVLSPESRDRFFRAVEAELSEA